MWLQFVAIFFLVSQNIYVFCGSVEDNNCVGILQLFCEVDESMRLN